MTVNMKTDLVGPAQRGLAMGLNEAAGYGALGATALLTPDWKRLDMGHPSRAHYPRPPTYLLKPAGGTARCFLCRRPDWSTT
jgi:hypothetical protein